MSFWAQVNKKYVAPGNSFTVTWGDYDEAKNNIYIQAGEYIRGPFTASNGAANITLNKTVYEARRGERLTIKVQEVDSSDGDTIQTVECTIKINTIPAAPQLRNDKNEYIIPSQGTYLVRPEAILPEDVDGKRHTLYWSKTSVATKMTVPSQGLTHNDIGTVSTRTSIYLWTYDGEEFSSSNTIIFIERNPSPSIHCDQTRVDATITLSWEASGGQEDYNSYRCGYTYNDIPYVLYEGTGSGYVINDMRPLIARHHAGVLQSGSRYDVTFWVERNDGIEDCRCDGGSWECFVPSLYLFPPKSTTNDEPQGLVYVGDSLDIQIRANYYNLPWLDQVSLFESDDYYKGLEDVKENNGPPPKIAREVKSDKLSKGQIVDMVLFKTKGGQFKIKTTNQGIKAYCPTPKVKYCFPQIFKPYSSSELILRLEGATDGENITGFPYSFSPHLTLSDGEKTYEAEPLANSGVPEHEYSIPGVVLYNLFLKKDEQPHTLNLKLSWTNSYGQTAFGYLTLENNWNEEPIIQNHQFYAKNLETGEPNPRPLENLNCLKEPMIIYANLCLLAFSTPTLVFNLEGYEQPEVKVPQESIISNEKGDAYFTQTQVEGYNIYKYRDKTFNECPLLYNINDFEVIKLKNISADGFVKLQARASLGQEKAETTPIERPLYSHVAPNIIVESVTKEEDDSFKIKYNIVQQGCNNAIYLGASVSDIIVNGEECDLVDFDHGWFKIKPETTDPHIVFNFSVATGAAANRETDQCFMSRKQFNEPITCIYYNSSPTIAYRQNQIGINSNLLGANEALAIHAFRDKNIIGFHGLSERGEEHIGILNLTDGTLEGLIIDGGTWS